MHLSHYYAANKNSAELKANSDGCVEGQVGAYRRRCIAYFTTDETAQLQFLTSVLRIFSQHDTVGLLSATARLPTEHHHACGI